MAQNIDGTANGTGIFNTKIPSYSESADIQAALRLSYMDLQALTQQLKMQEIIFQTHLSLSTCR